MGFDYIMIAFLLLSCCSFSFVFGCKISFFGRFQHPPVNDCSTASCDFDALAGGDEYMFLFSHLEPLDKLCRCPLVVMFK